jgi:hypothetical protein
MNTWNIYNEHKISKKWGFMLSTIVETVDTVDFEINY